MIGKICGILEYIQPPRIMVNVQGISYEIDIPMSSVYNLPIVQQPVCLYTHLIIREDAHSLYGFISLTEKHMFKELIKVSGIGSRTALAILSGLEVQDVVFAIRNNQVNLLSTIPGIGKKTAERLVLELSNRLDSFAYLNNSNQQINNADGSIKQSSLNNSIKQDAINALSSLGYSEKEAMLATKNLDGNLNLSDTIKQALNILSSKSKR